MREQGALIRACALIWRAASIRIDNALFEICCASPNGINSDPAFAVWRGRQLLRLWTRRGNRNRRYHTDRPDRVAPLGASIDTIASARGRSVSQRRATCKACCPTENLVRSDQALGGVLLNA
jgi:hypothetical protein